MKYLLLKHYRGGPAPVTDLPPMDRWTPAEVDAHIGFMRDFAARLEGTGEYVDGQALAPDGAFVRYDGEGRAPVVDGPFAETKEMLGGILILEAKDKDDAVRIMSRHPGIRMGPFEIRPADEAFMDQHPVMQKLKENAR